jgi:hypothetical protein
MSTSVGRAKRPRKPQTIPCTPDGARRRVPVSGLSPADVSPQSSERMISPNAVRCKRCENVSRALRLLCAVRASCPTGGTPRLAGRHGPRHRGGPLPSSASDTVASRGPLEVFCAHPALEVYEEGIDALVGEVKQGEAHLTPSLGRAKMLAFALGRVGCCPESKIPEEASHEDIAAGPGTGHGHNRSPC